jgi:hypothetical protein
MVVRATELWASSWSGAHLGEAAYLDVNDDGNLYVRAVSDGIVCFGVPIPVRQGAIVTEMLTDTEHEWFCRETLTVM